MKMTQTMTVDGRFVDARQAGSSARIVISSAPQAILQPACGPRRRLGADLEVPGRAHRPPLHAAGRRVQRRSAGPVDFSGLGMLSIVTVNFDKGLGLAHSDSLMADAQIVYGSQTSLYVATQKWVDPQLSVGQLPAGQTTVIDRFDVTDPDTTTFVASGEVPGYLLNQFSLSESGAYLRVASTSRPIWWGGVRGRHRRLATVSQSYVTVLSLERRARAGRAGVGARAGRADHSVRFIGDTGYVVTFHQVDPLYTVDLSTPTAPKVVGQLDLAGYSAYLHPVGAGLLLGVGTDVSSDNEPAGSAARAVRRLEPGSAEAAREDADRRRLLVAGDLRPPRVPVLAADEPRRAAGADEPDKRQPSPMAAGASAPCHPASRPPRFTGAIGYKVTSSGISEVGRVVQDTANGTTPEIERSVVVGSRLFTISAGGVMASSLDTLQRQAFIPFPS